MQLSSNNSTSRPKKPRPHIRGWAWLKLGIGIVILALFVYGLAPLGLKLPGISTISRFAKQNDIKVTAIYYTDIEEFSQAETDLRNQLNYSPEK
jgi:hypothetical protein